ncbi:hypothetical protein HMPREF9372_3239 [Sporosarcina newyorkensis 2681]|uniref:DUF3953 domain-containing protein n=1 Tax=Sporosarcina newyorkensis 2681 TaxID=1027292 RepID=F9DWQ8_9BACL|nr:MULTISPECIES: hypothetical protein [Sporosarcina]EGQ21620.1 hypothetical protein HMPREF9372_3239 [Sporosarcina newyorkensis 2681]MBY0221296.1 hypothetical protein [Sporosarcina aquimarina]
MRSFSVLSTLFAIIGVLLIGFSYIFKESFELLMVLGFGSLIVGSFLCFWAMVRGEKGAAKFSSVVAFFLLSFIIIWTEPFQIIRVLTWMKN